MALFKKVCCRHCNREVGLFDRTKLRDGNYICENCAKACSDYVNDNFLSMYSYNDYLEYIATREENRKKLNEFNITAVYFNKIFVDMDKGWFVFGDGSSITDKKSMLAKQPDVFEAKDLEFYNFYYKIKDVHDGIFFQSVDADVKLTISFKNKWYPYSFCDEILTNYSHSAEISGIIRRNVEFTDNELKSNLELYLATIAIENNVPVLLGDENITKDNFSLYGNYFRKLFELEKVYALNALEIEDILSTLIPNPFLRSQIKRAYQR